MSPRTIATLLDINRRFYQRFAAEFSASRRQPWPGWERILAQLPHRESAGLAVLDVGCGNGRFHRYLVARRPQPMRYLGVDESAELLAEAAAQVETGDRPRWLNLDVAGTDLEQALGADRFDLIAVFGVLHHLPGRAIRRHLLRKLAARLDSAGVLAISVWQLDRRPNFDRKVLPWKRYNQLRKRRPGEVELGDLDPGDHLLTWGGDQMTPRYCHFPDTDELATWTTTPGLKLVDRFEADGPSGADNLYLVFVPAPPESEP